MGAEGEGGSQEHTNEEQRWAPSHYALYAVVACLFVCLLSVHPYVRMVYILGDGSLCASTYCCQLFWYPMIFCSVAVWQYCMCGMV